MNFGGKNKNKCMNFNHKWQTRWIIILLYIIHYSIVLSFYNKAYKIFRLALRPLLLLLQWTWSKHIFSLWTLKTIVFVFWAKIFKSPEKWFFWRKRPSKAEKLKHMIRQAMAELFKKNLNNAALLRTSLCAGAGSHWHFVPSSAQANCSPF